MPSQLPAGSYPTKDGGLVHVTSDGRAFEISSSWKATLIKPKPQEESAQ